MARDPIGVQRRWKLLLRDGFTCTYCGARPGNDRLNIDHMIPHSLQGSDHDNNLVTACDRCNNGKSNRVAVPSSMTTGTIDRDGWHVWRTWGNWKLTVNPEEPLPHDMLHDPMVDTSCAVSLAFNDYWIAHTRWHDDDWHSHLRSKPWLADQDRLSAKRASNDELRRELLGDNGRWCSMSLPELSRLVDHPRYDDAAYPGQGYFDFCDAIDFCRTLVRLNGVA